MRNPSIQTTEDLRLVVAKNATTHEYEVSASNRPDLAPVRDTDQRTAINAFRTLASQTRPTPPSVLLPGEYRD